MDKLKIFAVINDFDNIELVMALSEIEAAQMVLKMKNIEKMTAEEVELGQRNIEAFCHQITSTSAQLFDYECPEFDLVTKALMYEQTSCYAIEKEAA